MPPAASPAVAAGTFYVATNGNDANAGTLAKPWRTLQKAANTVGAGSTVMVRGGTYAGFVLTRSGTPSAPITFTEYPGESAVVNATSAPDVIRISKAHDIVVSRLTVQGQYARNNGSGIRVDQGSHHVQLLDNLVRENRGFGISLVDATYVTVSRNESTGNAEGIYVRNAGTGVVISNNLVHHQDRMVVATQGGTDDYGGVGIALVRTTGGVVVSGNSVWGNRAVSPDWGYDGGAFEIYAASNVRFENNVAWDNRMVLETGSDGAPCQNNRFIRNTLYGATTQNVSRGMVLRCAQDMLIANNTFHRLDNMVYDLKHGSSPGTSIAGLRILNNIAVMKNGKIYGIESAMPSSVVVDYNLAWHEANGSIGSVVGRSWTKSLATFSSWTGFERHGLQAAPTFVNAAGYDYRLARGSAGIDRGTSISGVTSPFLGVAPDMGRFESY